MNRDEQRKKAQRDIQNAALSLFAEKGFKETTILSIAAQAGVSKGLVHHYFPKKSDLVAAVIRHHQQEALDLVANAPIGLSPRAHISWIVRSMIDDVLQNPNRFRLHLRALTDDDTRAIAAKTAQTTDWQQAFAKLQTKDAEGDATFFRTCMLGVMTRIATSTTEFDTAPVVSRLLALLPDDLAAAAQAEEKSC